MKIHIVRITYSALTKRKTKTQVAFINYTRLEGSLLKCSFIFYIILSAIWQNIARK